MIKGIIFDLNGTLDNTNQAIARAFLEILKKYFPALKSSQLKKFSEELMIFFWQADKLADLKYPQWEMIDIIKYGVGKWAAFRKIKLNISQFAEDYNIIRKKYLSIKPEFASLIKKMPKRGIMKFVFSQGNSKTDVLSLLEKSSLTEKDFTEIISTKSFPGEIKPSIKILSYLLKKYRLKAGDCLVVGDDILADIMPAKILGMRTILISDYVDFFAKKVDQIYALIKSKAFSKTKRR